MAETAMVTVSEIKVFCPKLDVNFEEAFVLSYVLQAQQKDLKPFIGAAMYFDLVSNVSAENTALLDGGESTDINDNPIFFSGVKAAVSFFAYARILGGNDVRARIASNSVQETENATVAEINPVYIAVKHAQSEGKRLMNEAIEFIDGNSSDYPLFDNGNNQGNKHLGTRIESLPKKTKFVR